MKIVMIRNKKKLKEPLNKILSQFSALKKHLGFKFWQKFISQKTLPWYLLLASDDVLAQSWLTCNFKRFSWRSHFAEYNEVIPTINIHAADNLVVLDAPTKLWQNPGKKALKQFNRWQSFCRLLKRQRGWQLVNGIWVVVDFKLLADAPRFKEYLAQLKTALEDLGAISSHAIPIYFFVEGLNELPGFQEYTAKLRIDQREQMFGFTLSTQSEGEMLAQLKQLFNDLIHQVDQKLITQLPRDQGAVKNAEVLNFPRALAMQQQKLMQLLMEPSTGSFNHKLSIRGLYLSDGAHFNVAPINQVVLKETGLGSAWYGFLMTCLQHKKRLLVLSFISLFLLILVWLMGTLKANTYLNDMSGDLQTYQNMAPDTLAGLTQLQMMANLRANNYSYFFRYLGICFPHKVSDNFDKVYQSALYHQFEPMLAADLGNALALAINNAQQGHGMHMDALQSDAALYNTLSAYLMLSETDHFDKNTLRMVLETYWSQQQINPDAVAAELSLLDDLAAIGLQPLNLNAILINKARAILGQQPLSIQAFFALKAKLDPQLTAVVPGGAGNPVFTYQLANIDGIYTEKGATLFKKSETTGVLNTLKASWVLGATQRLVMDKTNVQHIETEVAQFYQQQYENAWHSAVWGMSIQRYGSVVAARAALDNFATTWQALSNDLNTHLGDINNNDWLKLKSYLADNKNEAAVLALTQKMSSTLANAQSNNGAIVLSTLLLNQQVSAFTQLQNLAQTAPQPMKAWLNQLLTNTTLAVFNAAQGSLINSWKHNISSICKRTVGYGYPVLPNSYQDINPKDFSRMFKPNGAGNNFGKETGQLVTTLTRVHTAYGASFDLPTWLQNNLITLPLIQNAFFAAHNNVALNMQWTPLYLSKNLAGFTFTIGNQTLNYQNGPRLSQDIYWTPDMTSISIQFTGLAGRSLINNYQGSWSMLRLLKNANIKRLGSNSYQITFIDGNYAAVYSVKLNSGDFTGVPAVSHFSCGN